MFSNKGEGEVKSERRESYISQKQFRYSLVWCCLGKEQLISSLFIKLFVKIQTMLPIVGSTNNGWCASSRTSYGKGICVALSLLWDCFPCASCSFNTKECFSNCRGYCVWSGNDKGGKIHTQLNGRENYWQEEPTAEARFLGCS